MNTFLFGHKPNSADSFVLAFIVTIMGPHNTCIFPSSPTLPCLMPYDDPMNDVINLLTPFFIVQGKFTASMPPLVSTGIVNVTYNSSSFSSSDKSLWVCERITRFQRFSKGVFFGENPLNYTLSMFILQASLVCLFSSSFQYLLNPIGASTFVPQVLAGFITGHSVLGNIRIFGKWISTTKPFYVCETISLFGTMLFLFLVGVKIDPHMVMKTGRKTWAIAFCSCTFPFLLNIFSVFVLRRLWNPESDIYESIFFISVFLSSGSFHVTASFLEDLKLLNSEVGRLSISLSLLNAAVSAMWQTVITRMLSAEVKKHNNSVTWSTIFLFSLTSFIFFVLRPIMFWMIRKTPRGTPIREAYIISIFLMVLGCSFIGEVFGEHFMVGPVIMGLAVPDGPPLGSALVEKLETFVTTVLMPLFYFSSGVKCNISLIDGHSFAIVQPVALFSFVGRVLGTMLPSMWCNMSLIDSLSVGLITSSQGINHLLYLQSCLYFRIITEQTYAQMMVSLVWLTLVATPIVKFLYDPSKSYLSLSKRNIEHAPPNAVLPLIACMHFEENTLPIINVLEMSHSTTSSPVCLYALHLIQLKGRSAPFLKVHQENTMSTSLHSSQSENIISAFKSYQNQNMGSVMVKLFTSLSPYETMHDEICTLAADKRVCMLITPFHMQWISGEVAQCANPIRKLNRKLLKTAPCSVGILVERGNLVWNNPLYGVFFYSVGVVFIEGSDDREALTYAMRMADHPNVRVTVIRLLEPCDRSTNSISGDADSDLVLKFKDNYIQIKRHDYREEIVRDGVEMINFIRTLESCYDLVLVGRCHENKSSLFNGLGDWHEYPELGSIGDMLVSPDSAFDGSVLVVQQQRSIGIARNDFHQDSSINSKQSNFAPPV
ncbi:hypothetical protein VNO80_05560 [Phaseolus coccineus]|uniref:Cation/H+ exchanger domain-containing protein n=1 Tax=Phaseolus coccineus TaxID=3886 RepID=A0AAN9NKE6_PHACN